MKRLFLAAAVATMALTALTLGPATSHPAAVAQTPTTFTVTLQNVSQPNTIASTRAGGAVPLSPGPYAVYRGANPMFTAGALADPGTILIAEDGFVTVKVASLAANANVSARGLFESPGGPDASPAIFPGESATVTFTARPGDLFTLETMFVQSNDWFYADAGSGIALFDAGGTPLSGDITALLRLWDSGSELDTAPGTGPDQKPAQAPDASNVGPNESVPVQLAATRHPSFTIPANSAVFRLTISAQAQPTPTVVPKPPVTGTGTADQSDSSSMGIAVLAGAILIAGGALVLAGRSLVARKG